MRGGVEHTCLPEKEGLELHQTVGMARQIIEAQRLREHLEWLAQLKGLARNLNQLTRQAHAQGFAAVTARHATLQTELVRMIEALRRDR